MSEILNSKWINITYDIRSYFLYQSEFMFIKWVYAWNKKRKICQ